MYNSGNGGSALDDHQRTSTSATGTDVGNHNNGFSAGSYGFATATSNAAGAGRPLDYPTGHHQLTMHRQWYDEPLYANDTDAEFYMFGREGSAGCGGEAQGRRTLNSRREQRNGVISLRSAGDISLPQNGNGNCRGGGGGAARNHNQHKFQGNGDYSGSVSDIQSVTSRMSSVSVSGLIIFYTRRVHWSYDLFITLTPLIFKER